MTEWWTYNLEDLLLFSPQTYYRLFELYHYDIWPIQILAMILGVIILLLVLRNPPWQGRIISFILAACWLWVAWAYHRQHYASINWFADYFAIGFSLEAMLFIWIGIFRNRLKFRSETLFVKHAGLSIFIFAVFIQPFAGLLFGRIWIQSELFAITPDATVIATLGLLLLSVNKTFWLLYIIPLCWCLITGITLWIMNSPDALLSPLAAVVVLIIAIYQVHRTTRM